MPVEVEMLAGEIQFVARSDVLRSRRFGGDFAVALGFGWIRRAVSNDRFAVRVENPHAQRGLGISREVQSLALPRSIRRGADGFVQDHAVAIFQNHAQTLHRARHSEAEIHRAIVANHESQGRERVRLLDRAEFLVGPPVLRKGLRLVGREVAEVRLVVRENASHQLDIRPAVVGKFAVPRPAELVISPSPLLFAGADVFVGDMHEAALRVVVVATEEILLRLADHVARWHRNVFIPGQIVRARAGCVIDAVIEILRDRERRHSAHRVVGDIVDIRGEKTLVIFVDAGGDIRPPEEGLRERSAVVEAAAKLHEGAAGTEADAVHALQTVQRVVLGLPDSENSPTLVFDHDIRRQVGAGAVMLGPVELHAAGNPWPGEADKRGLDDILSVEKVVVSVRLVLTKENPATDFRQHHQPHEFILHPRRDIIHRLRRFVLIHLVDERHGINLAARALVNALLEKNRIFFRLAEAVGRDGERFETGSHRIHGLSGFKWTSRLQQRVSPDWRTGGFSAAARLSMGSVAGSMPRLK